MLLRGCLAFVLLIQTFSILCSSIYGNESVKIIAQENGIPTASSFLKYKKTIPDLKELAFCFRYKLFRRRRVLPFISYAVKENDNELLFVIMNVNELTFRCCAKTVNMFIYIDLKILKEETVCFSADLRNEIYNFMMNSQFHEINYRSSASTVKSNVNGNGSFYLLQEQDSLDGDFSRFESISGYIRDFSFYKRALNKKEMLTFANCSEVEDDENRIIDFYNVSRDFQISEVKMEVLNTSSTCNQHSGYEPYHVFFSGLKTFNEARNWCHSFGGELEVPKNSEEKENLYSYINKYHSKCERSSGGITWIGAFGNESSGEIVHYLTKEKLHYQNLIPFWNLNFAVDKCFTMYGVDRGLQSLHGTWKTTSCESKSCVSCYFSGSRFMRLKGLCENSLFDKKYFVLSKNGTEYFEGNYFSRIERRSSGNNSSEYWHLWRIDSPETHAIMIMKNKNSYPIGRNQWQTFGDECEKSRVEIKLTACKKTQFTCEDGSCIDLFKRCNFAFDCEDKTDEDKCLPLILPSKYSRFLPPPKHSETQALNINLFFEIHSILALDLTSSKFVTEATLTLSWRDSRVMFKNLKSLEDMNTIDNNDEVLPWIPRYHFLGDQNSSSLYETMNYRIRIKRVSEPLPKNNKNIDEDELFAGSRNDLKMHHKLVLTTPCRFDLVLFPFDSQVCHIFILDFYKKGGDLQLVPLDKGTQFSGNRKLNQYEVQTVKLFKATYGSYESNVIQIVFKSLSSFYVTNTYIPTFIMLIIGYLPLYFDLNDFNDRITVAVTSLLVEATFFTQLNSTTPTTSYMKMIDIWCLFCITLIFFIAISLTYINILNISSKTIKVKPASHEKPIPFKPLRSAKYVNGIAKVIFPIAVFIFISIYIIAII